MGGDFLAHFILGAHTAIAGSGGRAVRMQGALIDVLVVHHQQAFGGAVTPGLLINREEMKPIVVHAHLLFLLGAGVGGIGPELRVRPGNRGAPGQECLGRIALGNNNLVGIGHRNGLEAQVRLYTSH